MVHYMDFDEINDFWPNWKNPKVKYLKDRRNGHPIVKSMWDGYARPSEMRQDETILSFVFNSFPDDPATKSGRPLGDFKEIMNGSTSHQEAYEELVNRLMRPKPRRGARRISILDAAWEHSQKLFDAYYADTKRGRQVIWDRQLYVDSMLLMMYTSSVGVVMEERAHKDLEAWLKSKPKANKLFSYEEAPSHPWESKDVDGIFRVRETGEIAVKVSIKSVGAFTENFINAGYRSKGKTEPDIYAGYPTVDAEEIDFITVDGLGLKDLLRRSL